MHLDVRMARTHMRKIAGDACDLWSPGSLKPSEGEGEGDLI